MLVLHSDGLSDRWQPGDLDLPGLADGNPLTGAARLLRLAGTRRDDATVLLVLARQLRYQLAAELTAQRESWAHLRDDLQGRATAETIAQLREVHMREAERLKQLSPAVLMVDDALAGVRWLPRNVPMPWDQPMPGDQVPSQRPE